MTFDQHCQPSLTDKTLATDTLAQDGAVADRSGTAAQLSFHDQVIAILPKLRIQALALTRHRASAEDLVQDAVCNALSAQNSFIPGTNFPAWMHRILRNRFISNLRRRRETTDIDDVAQSMFATSGAHEDRLALKELSHAMNRLPVDQREALIMVVLHGMSYEELAEATGCAVGTAKSRVFRARRQLHAWLMGEETAPAPAEAAVTSQGMTNRALAAPASAREAKSGAAKSVTANSVTAKSGAAKSGAAKSGAARLEAPRRMMAAQSARGQGGASPAPSPRL